MEKSLPKHPIPVNDPNGLDYLNANFKYLEEALETHGHSTADIVSGVLPMQRGGTGATTAANARTNLGIHLQSGTWTPTLIGGVATQFTLQFPIPAINIWTRVGRMITCHFEIQLVRTSTGGGGGLLISFGGLPFAVYSPAHGHRFIGTAQVVSGGNFTGTNFVGLPNNDIATRQLFTRTHGQATFSLLQRFNTGGFSTQDAPFTIDVGETIHLAGMILYTAVISVSHT